MNPMPNLREVIRLAVLCASAALGDALGELLEALKAGQGLEWRAAIYDAADAQLPEIRAYSPHVVVVDWSLCRARPPNFLRALGESCPNAGFLAIGADPKAADLPPQLASHPIWRLPKPFTANDLRWAVLHLALCAGAEGAAEGLAHTVLGDDSLRDRLSHQWPRADGGTVASAIDDALLRYLANPRQLDQARGQTLPGFLHLVARRNLRRLLAAGRSLDSPRHSRRRAEPPAGVDAEDWLESLLAATDDVLSEVCARDALSRLMPLLEARDRTLLELRLRQYTTREIAEEMGTSHPTVVARLRHIAAIARRLGAGG